MLGEMSTSELIELLSNEQTLELQCDTIQMGLKITLNSCYGYLGNEYSRFYNIDLAEAITLNGQLANKWIQRKINSFLTGFLKTKTTDFVIMGDTDSCYITLNEFADKLPTTDKLKIVKAIDRFCEGKILPEINKGYDELADRMNSFKQKMIMAREVIADRAVVRAKKNYCLNVYNSEGVQYDEPKLKIMGLESARSSTPEICRNALRETLRLIMTTDEETTQAYIAKFKNDFMKSEIEDISFPRGINDIDKWILPNQKIGYFKSKTPIHVKGAITYNLLLEKHGIVSREDIRMGTKVKFVYLKAGNTARNNVIAFDSDLPKDFKLHKFVDKDLQYTKSYLDPIITILDLAKWQPVKKQSLASYFG